MDTTQQGLDIMSDLNKYEPELLRNIVRHIPFKPRNNSEFREAIYEYFEDPVAGARKNTRISKWDGGDVTDMSELFMYKKLPRGFNLSNWDVSNVTNMARMFEGANFNGNISNWDVSKVKDMTQMFEGSNFNQDISNWNVRNVEDMSQMFYENDSDDMPHYVYDWNPEKIEHVTNMFSDSDVTDVIAEKWGIFIHKWPVLLPNAD